MKILLVWARKSADELIISMAMERDFHPHQSPIAKMMAAIAKAIPKMSPVVAKLPFYPSPPETTSGSLTVAAT
jgi:hypothetical protein